jgi:hypothetical protein
MITGKILRDGQNGNGLISSNGEQYEFSIEKHWRSDTPPKLGASVNIEFDENGQLQLVKALDIQAEMSRKFKHISGKVQAEGLPIAQDLAQQIRHQFIATVGIPRIVIFVGLLLAWYALNTVVVQVSSSYSVNFNWFEILGFASEGNLNSLGRGKAPSSGLLGFLSWVSALLLFLPMLWKHRLAVWGAAAPLVFMVLSVVFVLLKLRSAASQTSSLANSFGGNYASQIADEMMYAVLQAISLGFGFYAAFVFAIAGAFIAFKKSR